MKIAICDDEKAQAALLVSYVKKWAENAGIEITTESFGSAESFLFAWSENKDVDVLLLDIQMLDMNGMDLARTIRQEDNDLAIIFITGYPDYMLEGYDVAALHYLLKPVNAEKLFACLDRASAKAGEEKFILLPCSTGMIRLAQREIACIEAFAHEVQLTAAGGAYCTRLSIGEIEARLDQSLFIRPHRSYIVGLRFVCQIGRAELLLDSGMKVPVSRRRYDEINRAFIEFYRSINP
jgi:DNA-binding LytR/AlgR family response regulator